MKFTKSRWLIAGLLTIFCLLLSLTACKTESGESNKTAEESKTKDTANENTAEKVTTVEQISKTAVAIVKDGKSDYSIVNCVSSNANVAKSAKTIQTLIQATTKVRIPIVEALDTKEGDNLIVIGTNSDFDAVTKEIKQIDIGEYGWCKRDNIIMIIGCTDTTLVSAVNEFTSALTSSVQNGNLYLEVGESGVFFNHSNWMTDVPRIAKTYSSVYDSGDGTYLLHYRNTAESACDELEGLLDAREDFTKTQGRITDTGNRTATYVRTDGEISYLWQKNTKILQVTYQIYTGGCVTIPNNTAETGYTKLGETKLALLPLNYKLSCTDQTDCGGFSAVMTLEDGRYIVIDGGYTSDSDALYNYLYDNNKRSDGITIAAWVLTHDHGDHTGAFSFFISTYGKKVNCEYIISNALPTGVSPTSDSNGKFLTSLQGSVCTYFKNETKILKMHAGQSIWFCNVELRMLFTHETYFPSVPEWLNETSLVFELIANNQTTLITADSEISAIDMLSRTWKNELHSDIYQINHHGYSELSQDFVDLVNPKIALWPSGQSTVNVRSLSSWRGGIYTKLVANVDECIVADGQAKILTLPYAKGGTAEYYTMDFNKRK